MTHQERVKIMKSYILADNTDFDKAVKYFWDHMMMFHDEFMRTDKFDEKEAEYLTMHIKLALKSMLKVHPELRSMEVSDFTFNSIYIKKHKFYHFQILCMHKMHAGIAIILPGYMKGVVALTNIQNGHTFFGRLTSMLTSADEKEVN